jgi:GPH family glycoside/pentoside/hexuronide:cation symporter
MLDKGLHGLCFSPYMHHQDVEDQLSEEQIRRRIEIIKPYTKWVRSFSCTKGNELTPKIAKDYGLKTVVGAWLSADRVKNQKEIDALIKLGKEGLVDIAVVGNETLMRHELIADGIVSYIEEVKAELPDIPVAYIDAYYIFEENPELIEVCDIMLINCYPFWEGASIELSMSYLRNMYDLIKEKAPNKEVIISETGWPSQGETNVNAEPSEVNAMKYFINLNNWAQKENIKLFYFSSFDESWKVHHEGDVGQRWGIWNKDEKLKY